MIPFLFTHVFLGGIVWSANFVNLLLPLFFEQIWTTLKYGRPIMRWGGKNKMAVVILSMLTYLLVPSFFQLLIYVSYHFVQHFVHMIILICRGLPDFRKPSPRGIPIISPTPTEHPEGWIAESMRQMHEPEGWIAESMRQMQEPEGWIVESMRQMQEQVDMVTAPLGNTKETEWIYNRAFRFSDPFHRPLHCLWNLWEGNFSLKDVYATYTDGLPFFLGHPLGFAVTTIMGSLTLIREGYLVSSKIISSEKIQSDTTYVILATCLYWVILVGILLTFVRVFISI